MAPILLMYQFVFDNLAKMTSIREVKRQPDPRQRAKDLLREWRDGWLLPGRNLTVACERAILMVALQQAEKN
jgi:hypothetical protein